MKIIPYTKEDLLLVRRALTYIKPYKYKFTFAFMCIFSSIGFGIIQPLLWGSLITSLFEKNFHNVLANISYIFIIYILQEGIGFLQSYFFSYLSSNIMYDFKLEAYKKILDLPVKAFDNVRIGEFLSRLQRDIMAIANIITNDLLNTIVDILKVIIIGITIFTISLPLSVITLIFFPISFIIITKSGIVLRRKNEEIASLNDDYFSKLEQSLSAIREIISLGIKEANFNIFKSLAGKLKEKDINLNVINTFAMTLSQGVYFISQIATMSVGGLLIFKGMLTMQYFIAFSSYSGQFSSSLLNVTQLNSKIQQVLISLQRVFELIDNLYYEVEFSGEKDIANFKGSIKFDNVSFKYSDDVQVLNNISFIIPENKKIAIVGSSGSGKTTIFNLLLRFYKSTGGKVLIDNIDISECSEACIRKHISIVRQEPFIFNMSIKDNLLLIKPSATDEEIYNACKSAYIHDYIVNLPDKYDSIIGENSINLSGGQKQRLAIARAILKSSKIIMFDEATSSLDNESQHFIHRAINELSKNHTIIIIAHRLSTIIEADEIIVIDKGEIAGVGDHSTLIDKNHIYKKLYDTEIDVIKCKQKEVV